MGQVRGRVGRFMLVFTIFLSFAVSLQESGARAGAGASPLVRIGEGILLVYKGTIKVTRNQKEEAPETFSASLEVGYLGMGPAEGKPGERVLLLRAGESQENEDLAFSEAVSLLSDRDFSLQAELPLDDRAQRVSWFPFNHLPLDVFPPLTSAEPNTWKLPARLHVFTPERKELRAVHRVEPAGKDPAVRYIVETEPDQIVKFVQDRVEIPFQVVRLEQVYTLSPGPGRLLSFESGLQGKFLGAGAGEAEEMGVEIELTLSEAVKYEGSRWIELRAEAGLVLEIERALFGEWNPEAAEAKTAAFKKAHSHSRLERFVEGLARQVDAVWPVARERRLYGKPAPNFTLLDLSGEKVNFSSLLPGKVTMLSFWSVG